MKTSESIKELSTALAKAQAVMAGAKKDATNPHYRSKYADLASCWEACRSALTSHGIAVVQMAEPSERDEVLLTTRLCHSSGEWVEGTIALPVSKADAQGYGSALTYARRYGLCAAVGIAPEDDDGNAAAAAKPPTKAIPANIEGKTLFEASTPEEKDYYSSHARALEKMKPEAATDYIEREEFSDEELLMISWLLPANVRNPIKEVMVARRKAKKTEPAYASQA